MYYGNSTQSSPYYKSNRHIKLEKNSNSSLLLENVNVKFYAMPISVIMAINFQFLINFQTYKKLVY
jgi:hypothetical protein